MMFGYSRGLLGLNVLGTVISSGVVLLESSRFRTALFEAAIHADRKSRQVCRFPGSTCSLQAVLKWGPVSDVLKLLDRLLFAASKWCTGSAVRSTPDREYLAAAGGVLIAQP